jgi:hypothetical protein
MALFIAGAITALRYKNQNMTATKYKTNII